MTQADVTGMSPSAQRAFDWATAVARVREGTPAADPDPDPTPQDLLVGTMLAHPGEDGEVRVLLSHFGLTLRDVLGEAYARVTSTSLATAAPAVSGGSQPTAGSTADVVATASQMSGSQIQLLHLLGGLLVATTDLVTQFENAFASVGETREVVASSYQSWLSTAPQRQGVAGQALREWLQRNNPRQPVTVAGFSTDDVANPEVLPEDFVGISAESNALAYLVASRDLIPPLAVGFFGDWGSGKSFLMRDVRRRTDMLVDMSREQNDGSSPVWTNIEHIEFNAWEYVQEDLWAGLLEKIFARLGTRVATASLVEARRQPLRDQLAGQQVVVERAEEASAGLTKQLETAKADVARANEILVQRQGEVSEVEGSVSEDLKVATDKVLKEWWTDDRVATVGNDSQALLDALATAWDEAQGDRALLGVYWRDKRRVAILAVAVAVVPVVTLLVQTLSSLGDVASVFAGLAAGVPVLTGCLTAFTTWSQRQRQAIEEARSRIREKSQEPLREAEQAVAEAEGRRAEIAQALADQGANLLLERQRALELEAQVNALTPGRVLADFADDRSVNYRRHLGLLGSVRADLRELDKQIDDNNKHERSAPARDQSLAGTPTVPNRIVLYIDDLDRCPPHKVVQVLEAVHLLLAFSMFVVFVAVDSRWLTSALTEELHALRPPKPGGVAVADAPTARDYLEKIFQLPFWVQPLSPEERSTIVTGLLQSALRTAPGAVGEAGRSGLKVDTERSTAIESMLAQSGTGLLVEASTLAVSPDELEFLAGLGSLLGDTPRRIKRFVNTVQFLLSIRPALAGDGSTPPRMAAALYAAIHEGLPSVAKHLFHETNRDAPLSSILDQASVIEAERDRLRGWLTTHPQWNQTTLRAIGERAGIVQRLGFTRPVGFGDGGTPKSSQA